MGDEIVIGREEILKVLHISSWRTVMRKRARHPGFKKLIRKDPTSGKPVILLSELKAYIVAFNSKR